MGGSEAQVDFVSEAPEPRLLAVNWIHGSPSAKHNTDPDIQVHAYDEHTFILRQNMAVNYEAPFLFLIFGNSRAALIDTGATQSAQFFPLRRVVDDLVGRWLAEHPEDDYTLLVLHTHGHGDHIAADAQFTDRPRTTVVRADRDSAWGYFGFIDNRDRVAGSTSVAEYWSVLPPPATMRRPSPTTTRTPDSCSPATRCTRGGCTWRTGTPSEEPSTV